MIPHAELKAKQRAIRDGFPEGLSLRVHRAISWLGRAEQEADDTDVRFILLWIGFNAAYSAHLTDMDPGERERFARFFRQLCDLDRQGRIYALIWQRFPQEVRLLLDNRYIFAPFWRHANGDPEATDWEKRLGEAKKRTLIALKSRDTPTILGILFDRLYVLRNQLVHGGATWNSSMNRDQLRDGTTLLGNLLPLFVDVMMNNPHADWGRPHYPVVD